MVMANSIPRLELVSRLRGGHEDAVWESKWSPSGDFLASCGADRSVCIWRKPKDISKKWEVVQKLSGVHTRTIRAVTWSPCGQYLATASFDATVCIWHRDKETGEFEQISLVEGHESEVKCLSWSPNGELLASCSRDRSIWLWGRENDEEEDSTFECFEMLSSAHSQDIKCIAFNPDDSNILASCGYDDSICIHRGESDGQWETVQTLQGHTSTVWALAFDGNNETNRLASAGADGTVRLWRRSNSDKQYAFEAVLRIQTDVGSELTFDDVTWVPEPSPIYDLAWSPNGKLLATVTGGSDKTLRVFAVNRPVENSQDSVFNTLPIVSKKLNSDLNSVQFMPSTDEKELVLSVTTDKSDILIFKLSNIELGELF